MHRRIAPSVAAALALLPCIALAPLPAAAGILPAAGSGAAGATAGTAVASGADEVGTAAASAPPGPAAATVPGAVAGLFASGAAGVEGTSPGPVATLVVVSRSIPTAPDGADSDPAGVARGVPGLAALYLNGPLLSPLAPAPAPAAW